VAERSPPSSPGLSTDATFVASKQQVLHHHWVVGDERFGWVLICYRAPKQPSTARVAAWRRLHRLGALYIGPSTCLVPTDLADDTALTTVAEGLISAGGNIDVFPIEAFSGDAQQALLARFNADRDAEYAEVLERAQALMDELEQETARGKFTFAEAEENEADLAKLRRWLDAIGQRDQYGAVGRDRAEKAIDEAELALQIFTERCAEADDQIDGGAR
jgi:Protein ChrB, N-terminal